MLHRLPVINQRVSVAVVYVCALFLGIIDVTIVNAALPSMARDFHVATTSMDVVSISYIVTLAVFIPASGWMGDRFGGKRTLITAIVIFTGASALCGLAQNIPQLVLFRALQGAGGGMLTPVGMAMLFRIYPAAERVRLAAILLIPTAMGPALGPVLGGLLVTELSWRWVFFINLPVGLGAAVFGLLFVTNDREGKAGRFDLKGWILAGIGFGTLVYGITEGPNKGWQSSGILLALSVGVVLVVGTVILELRTPEPMVDLRLFRTSLFRATSVVQVITMAGFFGILFTVPLYYQDGRGLTALVSGLSTIPEAFGLLLGGQTVSRLLYWRVGPRRLMVSGSLTLVVGSGLFALCGATTNLWIPRGLMFVLGLGIAQMTTSMQASAFATIPRTSLGRAATLWNANRQMGAALGIALLSSVMHSVGTTKKFGGEVVQNFTAYHAAFFTAAGLAFAGGLIAFFSINDADAAETMVPRVRKKKVAPEAESLAPASVQPASAAQPT